MGRKYLGEPAQCKVCHRGNRGKFASEIYDLGGHHICFWCLGGYGLFADTTKPPDMRVGHDLSEEWRICERLAAHIGWIAGCIQKGILKRIFADADARFGGLNRGG